MSRWAGTDPGTITTAGNGPLPGGRRSLPASRTPVPAIAAGRVDEGHACGRLPVDAHRSAGPSVMRTLTGAGTETPGPPTNSVRVRCAS